MLACKFEIRKPKYETNSNTQCQKYPNLFNESQINLSRSLLFSVFG
jgi:hypothetical protein